MVETTGITAVVEKLGPQQSNLPHIYRDGGGGGTVNGTHLIIFADGTYTDGPPPTNGGHMVNFISNSIAVIGVNAAFDIRRVTDFGTPAKGPRQCIPYFTDAGESDFGTAIWPNQNICELKELAVGVSYPEVIDRNLFRQQKQSCLYNTPIQIQLGDDGPVTTRPTRCLFKYGEPLYGSFATVSSKDGYIYLFARIAATDNESNNGLKLARVPHRSWSDRQQFQFWDGKKFGTSMPAELDNGVANVFRYSQNFFGKHYGPGTRDVFWNPIYGKYILLFQSHAAALDNSVYLSHSHELTGGWSTPEPIFKLPRAEDGFTYAFHAYPNMDPSGKVIPLTWSQDSKENGCITGTAEVVFS